MPAWDGVERRKSNLMLDEKLNKIDILEERITNWMNTTIEYRKLLCEKIDKIDNLLSNHITDITKKLADLPCRERKVFYDSVLKQIKWLWTITAGLVLAIIGDWVKKR